MKILIKPKRTWLLSEDKCIILSVIGIENLKNID